MSEHKHYSEYHSYMDGRIVIYKRKDHKKPKFSARFKIPNRIGVIVKSTKTADKDKAYIFAKQMYYDLEGKFHRGEVLKKLPFTKVFDDWVSLRSIEGKDKVYTFDDIRSSRKHILKFFHDHDIRLIDSFLINEFFAKRQSDIPKPSASTLKQEARRLNSIFTFAYDNRLIKDIPRLPVISAKPNPRPDFTQEEFNKLTKSMTDFVDEVKGNSFHYRARYYLQQYVLILKDTGLRVGEARKLRWIDIGKTQTTEGNTRLVFSVNGKTGQREVICMESVKIYTKRLFDFRTDELGHTPDLNEFVFCHKDGSAVQTFKKSFRALMNYSKLLLDKNGNKRVIYSLRHTYATTRLNDDVNIYQLAINMGTRVEMIEKFYGKKRTTAKSASELTKYSNSKNNYIEEDHSLPWE